IDSERRKSPPVTNSPPPRSERAALHEGAGQLLDGGEARPGGSGATLLRLGRGPTRRASAALKGRSAALLDIGARSAMIGPIPAQWNRGSAMRYLRLSAGLAVLIALLAGSGMSSGSSTAPPSGVSQSGVQQLAQSINHVVVLMQENRSFD